MRTRLLLPVCLIWASPLFATVPLFGPETFNVAAKEQLRTSRTVAAPRACDSALAVYEIVVVNGAADGSGRVKGGSITLNGVTVVTDAQIHAGGRIVAQVRLAESNALQIALDGDEHAAGSAVISLTRRIDLTTAVFAEKTYVQSGAKAEQFTDSFDIADLAGPFSLVLTNGSGSTPPADDVSIVLNGVEIISKVDIDSRGNQDVPQRIENAVTLAAHNTLGVQLKSNKVPAAVSVRVVRHSQDTTAPLLSVPGLQDGMIVTTPSLAGSGRATDDVGPVAVTVNGNPVVVAADGTFQATVALQPGANPIVVVATDCENNTRRLEATVLLDVAAPQVAISAPAPSTYTAVPTVSVAGTVSDDIGVAGVTVNGTPAQITGGAWTATVTLPPGDGTKQIAAVATDRAGRQSTAAVSIVLDATVPTIAGAPDPAANAAGWHAGDARVVFTCADATSGIATCSDPVVVTTAGVRTVTGTAVDRAGNRATADVVVRIDRTKPSIIPAVVPSLVLEWVNSPTARVTFHCTDDLSGIASCSNDVALTAEGAGQVVSGTAVDRAGNSQSASLTVSVDHTAPQLAVTPPASALTNGATVTLHGTAADPLSGIASVDCGGTAAIIDASAFTCTVRLSLGVNDIAVVASDNAGNFSTASVTLTRDSDAPVIGISAPQPGTTTNATSVTVLGGVADNDQVASVTVAGQPVSLSGTGSFSAEVPLSEGTNAIAVVARDRAGNVSQLAVSVVRFTVPAISIDSPADLAVLRTPTATIRGTVSDPAASVVVNGIPAVVSGGNFVADGVPLIQGRTVITATATNATGHVASSSINLYRDSIPPRVTVTSPDDGATVYSSPVSIAGTVDDIVVGTINAGQVTVTVNGVPAEVANRGFIVRQFSLAPGTNTLAVAATDQGGNTTVLSQTVILATPPTVARLVAVSGGGQQGVIGGLLPQPIVVRAVDGAGAPLAGRTLTFEVTENNGTVSDGANSGRSIQVLTNAQGEASVRWTLGTRAGAGNHQLEVSGDGLGASLQFLAVALTGQPRLIVADSGNNQFGIAGEELSRPLVAVVVDAGSNRLGNVPVVFFVRDGGGSFDGQPSVTVLTDSDGRAIVRPTLGPAVGADTNIFVAGVAGVADNAAFVASGRTAGAAADTRISGVVLDNTDLPIAGVSVRIEGTSLLTQTNAQGQFVLRPVPVGYAKLIVDGSTAQRPGTWPTLEFPMYTLSGNDNTVGMPIYLLPIDIHRGVTVDETHGGTITLPELPGFSLTIKPGSATFPGGGRTGTVSVTLVHADKMPMTPGFGQQPRFLVTIQPPGVHFDPPAPITFPNVDGLAPGAVTEMYSFDHDLGQFVAIGTGSVSEDGSVLSSDPGVGIIKGGWHCGGNPSSSGTTHNCPDCQKCEGQDCVPDPAQNEHACKDDGVPCTYDICLGGNCAHQDPTVTLTLESTDDFKITVEPKMPAVMAKAKITGVQPDPTASAQFRWETKIRYTARNGRKIDLDLPAVDGGKDYQPSFTAIRGGKLTIKATLLREGRTCRSAEQTKEIRGTNPPFADVRAALPSSLLAQMVCRESFGGLQFGAQLGMPLQHLEPDGRVGVGLMQVTTPTPSDNAFWNWRQNIVEGLAIYNQKRTDAINYVARVRGEHPGLRDLTEDELQKEIVTRYNGGKYWQYDAATNDWIDKPDRLNPWPDCKGKPESATCRRYVDLVSEANCQ